MSVSIYKISLKGQMRKLWHYRDRKNVYLTLLSSIPPPTHTHTHTCILTLCLLVSLSLSLSLSHTHTCTTVQRSKCILNVIYSCGGKVEFSASLLQSTVSHHTILQKSGCRFGAQDTFLISYFSTIFWEIEKFKITAFICLCCHFWSILCFLAK